MSRREVTAAETRQAILDAALRLFTTRGYGATSIAEVAEAAGVAVPTVYASVGKKPDLLRATLDRLDEIAEIPALAGSLHTEPVPKRVIEIDVHITRLLAERCGDVITALASAATVDPAMAPIYAAGMARHRAGAESTITRLRQLDALKPGVDPAAGIAVTATLTGHRTWEMLVRDHKWSFDRVETWLVETLRRDLLGNPA
jgi:AcrR family transcriptional regulator